MATVEAHARRHFGATTVATVPRHYLTELQNFLREYPDDYNFTVRSSAGYGVLTCLEAGCDSLQIPLGRLSGAPANGKGSVGSLEPYKSHIRTHLTHARSRAARMRSQNSTTSHSTGRLVAALYGSPQKLTKSSSSPALPTQLPQTARGIRKTSSGIECVELSDSDSDAPPAKKPRYSSPFKRPLGVVNSNIPNDNGHASNPSSQKPISPIRSQPPPAPPASTLAQALVAPHPQLAHISTAPALNALQFLLTKKNNLTANIRGYQALLAGSSLFGVQRASSEAKLRELNSELDQVRSQILLQQAMSGGLPGHSSSIPTTGFSTPALPLASTDSTDYDSDDILDTGLGSSRSHGLKFPIPAKRGQGRIDDIHTFIEQHNQEAFGGNIAVNDALKDLELTELGAVLPGMQISLLAHQVIGVKWMKSREQDNAKYTRGGILADAMGLGKTMQTIGVMCANPSDDPGCNATLIIAPLALLEQWRQEIAVATEEGTFRVLIYHGPSRPKNKKEVQKYDVVITTYHTLANEWPDEGGEFAKKKKRKNAKKTGEDSFIVDDEDEDETMTKKAKKYGPLMDIHWYRVVLDEAQNIRNAKTRISCAVTHIISDIRWCLTGTPLINGLNDAFGLLRFIQHRPFRNWDSFRNMVQGSNEDIATKRVQAALAGVLFRRTKESTLDGKKIITLPPRNENWVSLDFMEEERAIYDFVEARAAAVFNRFLQAGTVLKNYHHIFVMLMRLRQICVHPCLIKAYESAYEVHDTRSPEAKRTVEDAAHLVSNEFVALVKKNLRESALERIKQEKLKGSDATIEDNCSICFEPFDLDAVIVAPCAHSFCKDCIHAHITKPRTEEDAKFKEDERDCPLCRQTCSLKLLFLRSAFEPTDEELEVSNVSMESFDISWDEEKGGYKAIVAKKKGRKSQQVDDYSDLEGFIVNDSDEDDGEAYRPGKSRAKSKAPVVQRQNKRVILSDDEEDEEDSPKGKGKAKKDNDSTYELSDSDDDELQVDQKKLKALEKGSSTSGTATSKKNVDTINKPSMISSFLPSTKMQYMMKYLQELAETHPDDKTMIVSQWTSALDLCSDYLNENGIRHVRFQGSMNVRERNDAIRAFMTKPNIKVMLMSLKAGGVGLNLTRGSHVISLDLGWSNAIDQQAFDRVHRLGQTKEVHINRLIISNTVEDRVRAIQDRKQGLSDGALGEGNGKRVRLSVGELAHLFGLGPAPE